MDAADRRLRLGHGFRVEVRIVVDARRNVLRVPLSALFRDRDNWAVFVAADDIADLRDRGII